MKGKGQEMSKVLRYLTLVSLMLLASIPGPAARADTQAELDSALKKIDMKLYADISQMA